MPRLVMKFGGTSLAGVERIRNVARHVQREVEAGNEVAVVVSAMSGKTDELVAWCKEAGSHFDNAEYDAIVASGELVTAGLLALVLKDMGLEARSWQGWQIPLTTDDAHGAARISGIDGSRLIERLRSGRDRRRRRLPGPAQADQSRDDAGARRLRHFRGRARRRDRRRPLRHLYRRRRRLYDRSARRAQGAPARQGVVRGNARNGLARRQGAAGALGRSGHGAQGQALCALVLRRSRPPEARHADLRARRTSWNSRSSPASPSRATRRRSPCAKSPTSRASRRRSSCRSPTPTSTST